MRLPGDRRKILRRHLGALSQPVQQPALLLEHGLQAGATGLVERQPRVFLRRLNEFAAQAAVVVEQAAFVQHEVLAQVPLHARQRLGHLAAGPRRHGRLAHRPLALFGQPLHVDRGVAERKDDRQQRQPEADQDQAQKRSRVEAVHSV